jgi:transposase
MRTTFYQICGMRCTPSFWRRDHTLILHDNARAHTADAVKDLIRSWRWEILEHPSYSPDMSPCVFDLFAKMKEPLRGTR